MSYLENRQKAPAEWLEDIQRSVTDYDAWYRAKTPVMFAQEKDRADFEVREAMVVTDCFRALTPEALIARPSITCVARMCISPPLARDRLISMSGVSKGLVTSMEQKELIPRSARQHPEQLEVLCAFLRSMLDDKLCCWLEDDRAPSKAELDRALLLIGERLASAFYLAVFRNAQEKRQKKLLRAYLKDEGFEESLDRPFDMLPGMFAFGKDIGAAQRNGELQKLPADCVVRPLDPGMPLACIELKSAGDFTNVNKRRKEESSKRDALERAYGGEVTFLLQLFGYFGVTYLKYKAAAGIDWAWDHRLRDLAPYLGAD